MDSNQGSVDAAGVDAGIASADTSIEGTPPALVPDTGRIEFAKLSSACYTHEAGPSPLASPKSVYIAADKYQIGDLAALALANYRSQLSPHNVMSELFSEHAYAHREVEKAAKESAVANWKAVKAAGGLKSMGRACETGRLGAEKALKIAADLMEMVG